MSATPRLVRLQLSSANPSFRKSFGLGENDYPTWYDMMVQSQRQGIGTAIQSDEIERWLTSALSRRGKLPYWGIEGDLHDGRWIYMTETVCPDGSMLCIGSDITHLRHDERLLRQERDQAMRAALTDPLTGLSNRGHITSLLEKHIQLVQQSPHTCGLVLLDLDHFKRVNDNYGHEAGDTVLRHFAQLLPQVLRREDCHGRMGGEEFLLLLPNVTAASLCNCVQRLIDNKQKQMRCTGVKISSSGLVFYFTPAQPAPLLIHAGRRSPRLTPLPPSHKYPYRLWPSYTTRLCILLGRACLDRSRFPCRLRHSSSHRHAVHRAAGAAHAHDG